MVDELDKYKIIEFKQEGKSNREVARLTGYDRDTVSKYWNEFGVMERKMTEAGADVHAIIEEMFRKPQYQTNGRVRRKYTAEIDELLRNILTEDTKKAVFWERVTSKD